MVAIERIRQMTAALAEAGIEGAGGEVDLLFRKVTGMPRIAFAPTDCLPEEQDAALVALCEKRCTRYPLQYLLGEWGFYSVLLKIGEGVLIPRQDTETVVEQALALIAEKPAPRILDLCAGSGAIGIALHHERPDAEVTCVELSEQALPYLRENAAAEGVRVVAANVLGYEAQLAEGEFDLIVSNPPYVTVAEYAALAPELYYEPEMALVAAQEGLAFYDYIAAQYREKLRPDGWLCFEIGAEQRAAVCSFLEKSGYTEIDSRRDYGDLDRCVFGKNLKIV